MNKTVKHALTDLFELVADLCDGSSTSNDYRTEIRKEYERLMEIPEVRKFYRELVDDCHNELL